MSAKFKKWFMFIQDAVEGLWFNRNVVFSSIVIVMSSLCLFGAYISFSCNVNYISEQFKSQYAISAFLEKGTPDDRIRAIEKEIQNIANIETISFISEQDALQECKEMFGDDSDLLSGLEEDNPLRASFEITLSDISKSESVAKKLEEIIDVSWVKNNQDFVYQILNITSALKDASLILMLLFAAISIFIISNTIKISVSARKEDIYTMRYVGATNDYIVCPFIIEGIIIGIIGALVGFGLVIGGYWACCNFVGGYIEGMFDIYKVQDIVLQLFVSSMAFGLVIGTVGSLYAVKRYIKA